MRYASSNGDSPDAIARDAVAGTARAQAGSRTLLRGLDVIEAVVAAPVRDAGGRIVGAISVSSAAHYMDDDRMATPTAEVRGAADAIGHDLGWPGRR